MTLHYQLLIHLLRNFNLYAIDMKEILNVGTHISSDVDTMVDTMDALHKDINTVQFFVDPSNDYSRYREIRAKIKEKGIKVFIHSSYKINIAREWDESSWWVKYLIYEIKTANLLGAEGIVIHTGNKLKQNEKVALNNMYSFLLHIHNQTLKESRVKLIIETAAGQGTEMIHDIDRFVEFMNKFKGNDRFGVCLDTCHIFSAGQDIRKAAVLKEIVRKIKGISVELALVHLNDSKDDLGHNKDRHESLGYGYIGRKGLKTIIRVIKKLNVPIILETPKIHHDSEIKWIMEI